MIKISLPSLKSALLFLAVASLVLLTIQLEAWPLLVFTLYASTAAYVYTFFIGNFGRGEQVYYYTALMLICIVSYAAIYSTVGIIDSATNEVISDFTDLCYFSVVTWTTLGYGDFRPTPEARIYAASQAVLGYAYIGIFIAKLFYWLSKASPTIPNK